jgi:hypothetical protein
MDTRRFGINLALIALVFVATAHFILALIFNTGLALISALAGVGGVVILVLVNLSTS